MNSLRIRVRKLTYAKSLVGMIPLCLFVVMQFFIQGSMGIMSQQMKAAFNLDSGYLSIISSSFFYTFLLLQIPAGVLLDMFGLRRVITVACALLSVGCLLLYAAPTPIVALISRMVMGAGSAFAFLGMLKGSRVFFPAHMFALVVSLAETTSFVGVAMANSVATRFSSAFGFRVTYLWCAVLCALVAVSVYTFVRDPKPEGEEPEAKDFSLRGILGPYRKIFSNFDLWRIGAFSGMVYSIVTVFVALFAVPYVTIALQLTNHSATECVSMVYLGVALFSPVIGLMSQSVKPSSIIFIGSIVTTIFAYWVMSYPPQSLLLLSALMFVLGCSMASYQLGFALACQQVDAKVHGAAMGLVNMLCMLGGPVVQPIIGFSLSSTKGRVLDGFEVYSLAEYQSALSIIPLYLVLAIGLAYSFRYLKSTPTP